MMDMYHLIYKIINKINGHYYIGVHSTTNIEDGYMGSGSLLRKEIKATGLEYFDREILFQFENREQALEKEAELVSIEFISNPITYNLVCGGGKGVRTVKEKAIYFNRNKVNPVRSKAFEKFDPEYKTTFYLKNPISLNRLDEVEQPFNRIRNSILQLLVDGQNNMMQWLSNCWNNKFEHKFAEKFLTKIMVKEGFYNNIIGKEEKWT